MIKIIRNTTTEEHLIEGHSERPTGSTWIRYDITTKLDRVDHWVWLANNLGGTDFFHLPSFYIYGTANYYYARCIWSLMSDPKTLIFYLHRINAGESTYDLKVRFTQYE